MVRIAILMATYNGAAFLEAQLESVAAQEGVEVEVFARDDGSSDATLTILARHAERWPALAQAAGGERLGACASFLDLLGRAPDGFDAYAFCDQDDVWLPDKLARAAEALAGIEGPALYASAVRLVDADLTPIGDHQVGGAASFGHLLFENIAFGNTVVMNGPARRLIASRAPGGAAIMHDWWCALVAAGAGRLIFDPRPGVLYRQHGTNVIGGQASAADHTRRLGRSPRAFWPVRAQAQALLALHGQDLAPDHRALAERLVTAGASLNARLTYALTGPVIRARPLEALAARLLIAAGWY